MSQNAIALLVGWLVALAIFFGFIVLLRFIQYRERMALLKHGVNPQEIVKRRRSTGILRAGLITMMVGLSLTVGLYPVGFIPPLADTNTPFNLGPWLLPGLIPFGVGLALTGSYYLEQNNQVQSEEEKEKDKIISFKDRQQKGKQEPS